MPNVEVSGRLSYGSRTEAHPEKDGTATES
jgi:hypothetical protein